MTLRNLPSVPKSRLGVCLEMPLSDRPFLDRIAAAADLGFENAEMWVVDGSFQGDPALLAKTAEAAGVKITNTVIGSPDGTLGGGLTDPAKRDEWLSRMRLTFEFNRRAGIPATIVCTGNHIEGMSPERMNRSVFEGLKATAEQAEAAKIDLYLEPLNVHVDHAGYYLDNSDSAAELCRDVGSNRLKLLYDIYHMQIMEGDIIEHFRRNIDVIGHVHIAGVPGRNEPQFGELDYPYILAQAIEMGYTGLFGLEYQPTFDHEASLKATAAYLTGASS